MYHKVEKIRNIIDILSFLEQLSKYVAYSISSLSVKISSRCCCCCCGIIIMLSRTCACLWSFRVSFQSPLNIWYRKSSYETRACTSTKLNHSNHILYRCLTWMFHSLSASLFPYGVCVCEMMKWNVLPMKMFIFPSKTTTCKMCFDAIDGFESPIPHCNISYINNIHM